MLANSLKQSRSILKQVEQRMKQAQAESFEARLRCNKLLEERQAMMVSMERYRVRELELLKAYDTEKRVRRDLEASEKRAHQKSESLA